MARNERRRTELTDAAVRVLARQGSRGLTHRAVDAEAGVPSGTASNYFASRDSIVDAIIGRIGERLAPTPERQRELAELPRGREAFAEHVHDIVRRLTGDRDAAIGLFELRLEATRRPEVGEAIGTWLRAGLEADVEFNEQAALPGSRADIVLFHYAIEGFVFDQLTTPIDPAADAREMVDLLVQRILPG